ncbi:AAA family ATPase [Methylophilus methylotrophus]|jgi:hypothetical protein|uniref:AAA family ATPase n=1 Tax=Methylophilus methylotrophus TaxID=17 RepID=UPI000F5A0A37|nr:AAA family ATPase [Methylophilus methylotrophus]
MTFFNTPNPLLEKIPEFNDLKHVVEAMRQDPLRDVDIPSLSFIERDALLSGEKVILNPTKMTIKTVMTWYGMLVTGLHNRNPLISANRTGHYEMITAQSHSEMKKASRSGISINVVKGPPGNGKSVTIQGFCSLLPEVVDHGLNEAAGWAKHQQLVWLHINLPHDGSRGGFLTSILESIDNALDTQYAITIPKQYKTIEKLSVATLRILTVHHTGIIFIDEAQLRNLVRGNHAELMQLFILQLMNTGIPIVISGNERALDWVEYCQDISRLTLTEISHFHPVGALDEPGWKTNWEALCDNGVMKYYVLTGPIQSFAACSQKLYECSGGIARLALTLWTIAQRDCLYRNVNTICPDDIEAVYKSTSYAQIRPLADGFRYRSIHTLAQFPDVDVKLYESHWQMSVNPSAREQVSESFITETAPDIPRRTRSDLAKFKSDETRQRNRKNKSEQLLSGLGKDDMRLSGTTKHNLDQLAKLQMSVEG